MEPWRQAYPAALQEQRLLLLHRDLHVHGSLVCNLWEEELDPSDCFEGELSPSDWFNSLEEELVPSDCFEGERSAADRLDSLEEELDPSDYFKLSPFNASIPVTILRSGTEGPRPFVFISRDQIKALLGVASTKVLHSCGSLIGAVPLSVHVASPNALLPWSPGSLQSHCLPQSPTLSFSLLCTSPGLLGLSSLPSPSLSSLSLPLFLSLLPDCVTGYS